jgi:hypothetical protein
VCIAIRTRLCSEIGMSSVLPTLASAMLLLRAAQADLNCSRARERPVYTQTLLQGWEPTCQQAHPG